MNFDYLSYRLKRAEDRLKKLEEKSDNSFLEIKIIYRDGRERVLGKIKNNS